jgi:Zn-dependent M28 family amino/carboxypeptidase
MAAQAAGIIAVLDPAFNTTALPMLAGMTAQQNAPIALYGVAHAAFAPAVTAAGLDLARLRAADPAAPVEIPLDFVLRTATGRTAASVPNVVAMLPGSDPSLRNEYVVFSAHMDHVGVDASSSADSIWNGADDDASGTAAVIELAKAFSEDRPRRSLIFLTVSGEEKGLQGSRWFAEHPPVPIQQIVADLNMDMIGRNWRDTIVAIGREHSDLGATLHRVNAAHPELRMTAIGDLWPQENFYFRSDHFNFARRGVPILFFFSGVHADYHRPSDSAEKIDYEKESRIVRLIFYLGQAVANQTDRPKWNAESYQRIVKGATKP